MSLASAAGVFLKPQTPLQQLLEDINFQRTKEMRQLLKDDSGFVVLQGTTYWTDLFVRHFLFQSEPKHSIDSDDLLFFVRKKHVKSSSRHMPKFETEVEVFRKDSRKLPIGDPDVDWEETVYLNMIIHQFDYTLTLAICTRTSPKELQVLRRHSQRVYASPSRRKMDTKGDGEEITYPHICFMVDNFDEVFSDILVRDGEMVCVELVANDKDGSVQGVIFLGSIRYDALKKVYDARQSSLSSKVAQRMSFGLFSSGAAVQTRCEFVRMKGPQGKGHAEMAVTKPKGSGVETPTSEPGYCATDMWDDWEEENDDYCTYRHQRRLSDPSANLNNFTRYAWRTKTSQDCDGSGVGGKARSENEGLDTLASEVSEIEAGDLRDDQQRPAFSASEAKLHLDPSCEAHKDADEATKTVTTQVTDTSTQIMNTDSPIIADAVEVTGVISPTSKCGNCFGGKKCKRWISTSGGDTNTPEMSEVYCPTCKDAANETPACLNKMPDKKPKPKFKRLLSMESEMALNKRGNAKMSERKSVVRSSSLSAADKKRKPDFVTNIKDKPLPRRENNKNKNTLKESTARATQLLSKVSPKRTKTKTMEKAKTTQVTKSNNKQQQRKSSTTANNNEAELEVVATVTVEEIKSQEYEIADDATSLNGGEVCVTEGVAKMAILSESDAEFRITVRGKEELPVVEQATADTAQLIQTNLNSNRLQKCVPVKSEIHPLQLVEEEQTAAATATNDNKGGGRREEEEANVNESTPMLNDCNGNCDLATTELSHNGEVDGCTDTVEPNSTLPRAKNSAAQQAFYNKAINLMPKRRTPDGTDIYYWCDLPKKVLRELDDGAYNPLWASRGFTQSFHFWKESRRQQSTPLNAFLTYVTLPWWSIAKDLLDHRENPILTF